jgi:membrane fusion protein, multidrug efflux system
MNKKNIALLVVVVAIAGAGAWYVSRDAATATATSPAPAGARNGKGNGNAQQGPTIVNVVAPVRQDVPVMVQANGTVSPVSTVDLHPQTTAAIRKVHIREGQFVKAGELMFTLDDRSGRASVDKARAQVARDQATLADLERQYKRSQELLAQKFIAQSAADTVRSQYEAQRALVGASQAALQVERVNESYTDIRAPMAGRVGAINVFAGSLVQPATSLTTITQLDPINVAFTVPEAVLADMLASQKKGEVAVTATAGAQGKPVKGKLSFIDNTVDPQAGSIKVKAVFDNKDSSLWPGQYVTTQLSVQVIKDAVVIPQSAIITNAKGTFVYAMDADQSARQVAVTRLHGFGTSAAVTGLNGDEQIITEGKQNLRPGGKVKLADAGGPEGGAKGGRGKGKAAAQ